MIAQQRGTPVVVNFWASWCPPCREETPDLVAAHHRWGDRVRFIGVDLSDDRDGAASFIGDYGVAYPSVFDPTNAIAVAYGLFSPPATLFFDADGTLTETVPGQISPRDLEANIEAIAT
jgi:cytochrome c biogenesis protein CcmG/thiol:disulfide interchange protein DsbE